MTCQQYGEEYCCCRCVPHSDQENLGYNDIFTKDLSLGTFKLLCNKLDMLDIYAPASSLRGSIRVDGSLYGYLFYPFIFMSSVYLCSPIYIGDNS